MTKKDFKNTYNYVYEEVKGSIRSIIKQIRHLIKEGNVRSIVMKTKSGRILLQIPLTAGIAGSFIIASAAPLLSSVAAVLFLINDVHVYVERATKS